MSCLEAVGLRKNKKGKHPRLLIRGTHLALSGWFKVGSKDKIREAVSY